MKMIGWDDEFGGAQVGMAWLWGSRGKLAEDHRSSFFDITLCFIGFCFEVVFGLYTSLYTLFQVYGSI
ncbi:hypothetical protein OA43_21380 [Klebsiella variicola]|nr:hypothetical protein OA43_21380 [Klebsiella variicola]